MTILTEANVEQASLNGFAPSDGSWRTARTIIAKSAAAGLMAEEVRVSKLDQFGEEVRVSKLDQFGVERT